MGGMFGGARQSADARMQGMGVGNPDDPMMAPAEPQGLDALLSQLPPELAMQIQAAIEMEYGPKPGADLGTESLEDDPVVAP